MRKIELSTFYREVDIKTELSQESEKIFKFVTCGDLSGFDQKEEK